MDSLGIIIVGIVVSIVIGLLKSSAKKKQREQAARNQEQQTGQPQQQQPVRPPAMSEIQRVFSMMNELTEQDTPQSTPPPRIIPERPIPANQPAAYTSVQGKSIFANGMQPHEGLAGNTEGRAFTHEGKTGETEGRLSTLEGKLGKTEGVEFHGAGAHDMPKAYSGIDLKSVTVDLGEDDFGNLIGDKKYQAKPKLKLFENQSDYMKAIIFSEILPRKSR